MKRILAVDDDPSIRSFLKRGLSYEGYAVDVAESGEEALSIARDRAPDLMILDVMMPGIDGFEVLRRMRAAGDGVPVIMLTGKDAPSDQVAGLEIGADDYVIKPISFDVLLARVRALLRRQGAEVGRLLRVSDVTMDTEAFTVMRGRRAILLTNLEFKLLHEFLEQPERVMSKPKILDRVWGTDFFGDQNVVEVYVKLLRQKLEAEGESRLIHTIRNVGYVLRAN
jgi:DNA-binding response OmpR family regulator